MKERRWSVDYFRSRFGFRNVPVELGKRYTDENWTQTIMTINTLIDQYITRPDKDVKGYLAQHQLIDQIHELRDDIEIPDYCFTGESDEDEIDINSWFGPAGTISPIHNDPKHNFLCQVFGQKHIVLCDRDQSEYLYPFDEDQVGRRA